MWFLPVALTAVQPAFELYIGLYFYRSSACSLLRCLQQYIENQYEMEKQKKENLSYQDGLRIY